VVVIGNKSSKAPEGRLGSPAPDLLCGAVIQFFRFYWNLLPKAMKMLLSATERVTAVVALVAALLALLNQTWSKWLGWGGFSPAWVLLPIGLLVLYGLLSEAQREAEEGRRLAKEQADRDAIIAQKEKQIAACQKDLEVTQKNYKVFLDWCREHHGGPGV